MYDEEGWNVEVPPPYGDATYLDVSLYQVELTVPETMVVAASGSLIEIRSHDNNTKTLQLASGPMRDFYLALRADYQTARENVDGTIVTSYYPPSLQAGGLLALLLLTVAWTGFRFGTDALDYVGDWQAELDGAWDPQTHGRSTYWNALHPSLEPPEGRVLSYADVRDLCAARASELMEQAIDLAG